MSNDENRLQILMNRKVKELLALFLEVSIVLSLWRLYRIITNKKKGNIDPPPIDEVESVNVKLSINPRTYATKPLEYQTWVDVIFNRVRLPFLMTAISIAAPIFLVNYFISKSINFDAYYVSSPPIHLGIFGIIWVCIIIRYSSVSFHYAYEELRPCFLVSDEQYSAVICKWFKKLASHKGNIVFSLGLALVALLVVYISFFRLDIIQMLNIKSFRPTLFLGDWYSQENTLEKAIIIGLYGLYIAFPFGTAIRLLIINFFFLLDLRRFPVIPFPNVIKFRLTKITNLYSSISLSWFVGVALFGILLFHELDVFSITSLLLVSSLGLVTFLTPQFIYRIFLVRSSFTASQWQLTSFYNQFGFEFKEKNEYNRMTLLQKEVGMELPTMGDLTGFIQATNLSSFWVYDPKDILLLLLGQGLAFGSVFFERIWKAVFS